MVLASTDDCKAEILCNFFSSVFSEEKYNDFTHLEINKCTYVSEVPLFQVDDITSRLLKLNANKSAGPDGIHPKILCETSNQIAYPLKLLFETSFNTKELHLHEWTFANITPLHKRDLEQM